MMYKSLFTSLIAASGVLAASVPEVNIKRAMPSDTDILNYALTLEHLENAFYSGALSQFDAAAFTQAGYPAWVRDRFQQIADHESTHVTFLSTALGNAATKPCEYSFPYTDPRSFAALSAVLEGVGSSAYTGAAHYITTPAYLTAAASILVTEARHTAWVQSAVMSNAAWSSAFETPLDLSQVYSLAAPFIKSCPQSNPMLPVRAFPSLTVSGANAPGDTATFTFNSTGGYDNLYAAFFSGLGTKFVALNGNTAAIPADFYGTSYVVISRNGTGVSDDTTVAGPAILQFRLPESARQTGGY